MSLTLEYGVFSQLEILAFSWIDTFLKSSSLNKQNFSYYYTFLSVCLSVSHFKPLPFLSHVPALLTLLFFYLPYRCLSVCLSVSLYVCAPCFLV
uniref:Uncharacterized protein n=1 Tax=Octopus bimaculoides TaxID=37653 RepID=A0A0L8HPV8_OCTBM